VFDVEVILCAYKPEVNILDSVKSVLSQTHHDIKLSVILDGSCNADIKAKLFAIQSDDRRLNIQSYNENLGLTYRLVEALELSNATYIGRIDSGDLWHETKIEKQIETFDSAPDIVLVGTQSHYIKQSLEILKTSRFPNDHNEITRQLFKNKGPFEHSSIMFKNIINYRQYFVYAQDHDLYLRASHLGKIVNHSEALTYCVFNFTGISFEKRILQEKYRRVAILNARYNTSTPLKPPVQSRLSKYTWKICKPIYRRYIESSFQEKKIRGYLYLLICCLINYDLALIYLRRF